MPDDKRFPDRIDCGILWQQREHAFDPRQLHCHGGSCHTQAVLFDRARRHNLQLDQVLRNDLQFPALLRQNFKGARGHFVLRVSKLDGAQKCAGVDEHAA